MFTMHELLIGGILWYKLFDFNFFKRIRIFCYWIMLDSRLFTVNFWMCLMFMYTVYHEKSRPLLFLFAITSAKVGQSS